MSGGAYLKGRAPVEKPRRKQLSEREAARLNAEQRRIDEAVDAKGRLSFEAVPSLAEQDPERFARLKAEYEARDSRVPVIPMMPRISAGAVDNGGNAVRNTQIALQVATKSAVKARREKSARPLPKATPVEIFAAQFTQALDAAWAAKREEWLQDVAGLPLKRQIECYLGMLDAVETLGY